MEKCLTKTEIASLFESHATRESFGPETEYPYLAFDLACDQDISDWLRDLPCPVIGVGQGFLANACDVVLENTSKLGKIARNIENAPIAAMVLVQHLRASEHLSARDALIAESLAYATVQMGPEFMHWLEQYEGSPISLHGSPLKTSVVDDKLSIILTQAETHNAINTFTRDALCEALDLALIQSDIKQIFLTGEGRIFSTGGAVAEFGEVLDPATAHWIRSLRLPAWRLVRLKQRMHVHINGPAIGAGLEMAAFAPKVTAHKSAWFQLPELKYGLIPGAGGTVSLPRRLGRQRTAYMALTMDRIRIGQALEWGLVDAIID